MLPKIRLPLALLLMSFLVASVDAEAFWKTVGKKSGPGPFWGFDGIFAFHLHDTPTLTPEIRRQEYVTLNRHFFTRKGDKVWRQVADLQAFLDADQGEFVEILGEKFDIEELKSWKTSGNRSIGAFRDAIDRAAADPDRGPNTFLDAYTGLLSTGRVSDSEILRVAYDQADAKAADDFGTKYRLFGTSYAAGLFGSQLAVPSLAGEETSRVKNLFITVSVGYSQSWENELPYPEEFDASKMVQWITVFPALEKRVPTKCPCIDWFVNVGPAFHYFWGEAFPSETAFSTRGRGGLVIDHFQVGAELDVFMPELSHMDFGSTDTGTHRFGWAIFIGWEFARTRI